METVGEGYTQHTPAILHAAGEVDAGCLFKIFCGACNFCYLKTIHEYLGDHFIIENEIIAVGAEVYGADDLCAECTVAGMVFAQLLAEHNVFKQCKTTVEYIFIDRHAAFQRTAAQDT